MSEVIARQKFSCAACGAEAVWDPGKQALVCAYCGTISPAELGANGEIREHDLAVAMRGLPAEQRDWKAEKKSVKCQHCQAVSLVDPKRVAQRCDFCGSASIIPYEQTQTPIRPESLLQFVVTEGKVREQIRQWYGSRWFAPNRLKSGAMTDQVHGVYLPYWTFDAQVHADWRAESGTYYYTTESYQDANGKTQTRQVRHVRWWPSSGAHDHFFNDDLIAASKGIEPELLRKVEPFPTDKLVPYDAGYVAGWVVEQYQLDLIAATEHSRERMTAAITAMCAKEVPGDTHRNLQVSPSFANQTFKHVLLPIWLLSFNYGSKSYQAVVNGYTGQIAGKYPLSWVKVSLAVIAGIIIALIVFVMMNR